MCEKRLYQRLQLNIDVVCYINGIEFLANLKDISESGIAFEVTSETPEIEILKIGDEIKFWGVDCFKYLGFMKQTVISGACRVVRIDGEGDKVVIGCKLLYDKHLQNYIKDRKVARFINNGFTL